MPRFILPIEGFENNQNICLWKIKMCLLKLNCFFGTLFFKCLSYNLSIYLSIYPSLSLSLSLYIYIYIYIYRHPPPQLFLLIFKSPILYSTLLVRNTWDSFSHPQTDNSSPVLNPTHQISFKQLRTLFYKIVVAEKNNFSSNINTILQNVK